MASCLAFGAVAGAADQGTAAGADSYTWSAELIGLDAAAHTVTVRARIEQHADLGDLERFHSGDAVTIQWTGRSWGAGIRGLEKGMIAASDSLTLPAEFVRTEMGGQYLVFRVAVPPAALASITNLEPGRWVTATSPRHATHTTEAVSAIRPYSNAS